MTDSETVLETLKDAWATSADHQQLDFRQVNKLMTAIQLVRRQVLRDWEKEQDDPRIQTKRPKPTI